EDWQTVGGKGADFRNDFHSRHSLSAGGPGAYSAFACVVSLATLFPQESRTFRSNQLNYSNEKCRQT
ncbi:hypothetical protein, partial [Peribacillus frigoritolerans]|uniref:hypothetical protein n=1 Tax=Peribacillus frigoritolerans TaxID=450367 RepID=UPI002E1E025E|nr:hypothetical protein [Peribacillus frigoritolerans]